MKIAKTDMNSLKSNSSFLNGSELGEHSVNFVLLDMDLLKDQELMLVY